MNKGTLLLTAAILFSWQAYSQNLVVDYNFNNGTATDISGKGHDGIINGGVTPIAGQSGQSNTALKFDGSTGYIEIPTSPDFDLRAWTLMAKVKLDSFYTGPCQINRILTRGDDYEDNFYALEVEDNESDNSCSTYTPDKESFFGLGAGTFTGTWDTHLPYIKIGEWYCLTATLGNDTLTLYVNGVVTNKVYYPNQYVYPAYESIFIGRLNSATFPYWFNGVMDQVTIWDSALSASQVNSVCYGDGAMPSAIEKIGISTIGDPYPNPANSVLNIPVKASKGEIIINVLSIDGRNMITKSNQSFENSTLIQLDMNELKPGIYFIQINNGEESVIKRITKL